MAAIFGKRVIIVEDNFLIAEIIEEAVQARGGLPIGPYHNVDDVLEFLHDHGEADLIILDWHLDRTSVEVAALAKVKAIPIVFVTGYAADLPIEFRGSVVCCKPFTPASLGIAMAAALDGDRPAEQMSA